MGHPAPRTPAGRLTVAVLLFALSACPLQAAPRDELLRYVPEDVAFCVAIQDLRGHAAALRDSPFAAHFRESAVAESLRRAKEWTQLDAVEAKLRKHLGVDWAKLRDDILGEAIVFAYLPGPPENNDQERGLILIRARNARALADLVDRINQGEKDKGELKGIEERQHEGVTYFRREERKRPNFYCLRGPVLVFSGDEALLKRALELERRRGEEEPPVARRFREAGADRALAALWVNPRALDAQAEGKPGRPGEAAQTAHRTFVACWKALDSIVVSLALERDLSLSVAVRGRPEALPGGVRRFLADAARPSDLWRVFPDNALVALALRVSPAALYAAVGDFLTPEGRQDFEAELHRDIGAALGKDFVKEVLPALGPDVGLCVTAPPAEDRGWFPQAVVALRVAAGNPAAPLDQDLLAAAQAAGFAAVVAYNREHHDRLLSPRRAVVDGQEVKYWANDRGLLPGLQPVVALRDGYLVLASSLDTLRRFRPTLALPAGDVPLLRVSFKDARLYLRERREALAQALADREGVGRDEAARRLDGLLAGLQFVDRVELRQRTTPGQAVLTLSVQPARPFKK
jgi:hypothetical protein